MFGLLRNAICALQEKARLAEAIRGATLRFYDVKIDAWRSTWIGPVKGKVIPFIARQIGDEIVLEGKLETGTEMKWIFSEITKNSFHWRSIESTDGWMRENEIQEMFYRRMK